MVQHVTRGAQRTRVWSVDQVFLDVGGESREEVEAMGIRPGDGIAPWSPFAVLGDDRYAAKGWDDRVGLAVMVAAGVSPPTIRGSARPRPRSVSVGGRASSSSTAP